MFYNLYFHLATQPSEFSSSHNAIIVIQNEIEKNNTFRQFFLQLFP